MVKSMVTHCASAQNHFFLILLRLIPLLRFGVSVSFFVAPKNSLVSMTCYSHGAANTDGISPRVECEKSMRVT
jgi:hypothetical protein